MRVDDLVECDTFLAVDQVLVKWLIGRLVSEDIGAIVNGLPFRNSVKNGLKCTLEENREDVSAAF